MPDDGEELRPAIRQELMDSLAFAMRYQGRRRMHNAEADSFMAHIAAERLADHLHVSGFVVMKKPPLQGHSDAAHHRPRLPLKD